MDNDDLLKQLIRTGSSFYQTVDRILTSTLPMHLEPGETAQTMVDELCYNQQRAEMLERAQRLVPDTLFYAQRRQRSKWFAAAGLDEAAARQRDLPLVAPAAVETHRLTTTAPNQLLFGPRHVDATAEVVSQTNGPLAVERIPSATNPFTPTNLVATDAELISNLQSEQDRGLAIYRQLYHGLEIHDPSIIEAHLLALRPQIDQLRQLDASCRTLFIEACQ